MQQIGKPQAVYDDPDNLFVAKFLGTPPINAFNGSVKGGKVYIGEEAVLSVNGVNDGEVYESASAPKALSWTKTAARLQAYKR